MNHIEAVNVPRGDQSINVDFKCEEQVMETMHETADNLKIVHQDTTVLDCAISPKHATNHSVRTFSS